MFGKREWDGFTLLYQPLFGLTKILSEPLLSLISINKHVCMCGLGLYFIVKTKFNQQWSL